MQRELITIFDLSGFGSLWYWVMLAVAWSRATYWTFGIPLHDARLAFIREGQYMTDFENLVDIYTRHYTEAFDSFGVYVCAGISFLIATLATLGWGFNMEIMQALALLIGPLIFVNIFSMAFAYRQRRHPLSGLDLYRAYAGHRRFKQIFGALSILLIAVIFVLRLINGA